MNLKKYVMPSPANEEISRLRESLATAQESNVIREDIIQSLTESNARLLEALRMIADLTDENLERFGPQSANATIDEWARAAIAAEGEK